MSRSELTVLLAGAAGAVPSDVVVDEVLARSEGIPFYAEEVLAARGDAEPLPARLREAIPTGSSRGTPRASIALLRNPIIAMDRTTHSAFRSEKLRPRASRASSSMEVGTAASALATPTAARSASDSVRWWSRAEVTCSRVAPRRRANEQLWAEQ